MKYRKPAALVAALATAALVTGCAEAEEKRAAPAAVSTPEAPATTPAVTTPAADSTAKAEAPDACDLLTIAQIKEMTGLAVSVRTNTPDRCIWVVEDPEDNHYGGLTIGVQGYASAKEAEEQFKWFVDEKVPGIGDEASVRDNGLIELTVRVGAAKISIAEQNPAITRDILFELGRAVAANAG